MRIVIAVPHTGTLKADMAHCLGMMLLHTARVQFESGGRQELAEIDLAFGSAGPLDWKRTNLALTAQRVGADYILWIDSDQTFPHDALTRLLVHNRPMVAGNYPSRHVGLPTTIDGNNQPVPRRSGLEQVAAVGFGFMLMKTAILEQVPHPWFTTIIEPDGHLTCGEDVHFCNQARAAGVPIFVDHDLVIGHIAEREMKLEREDDDADSVLPTARPNQ
jgi:hypothetical protein